MLSYIAGSGLVQYVVTASFQGKQYEEFQKEGRQIDGHVHKQGKGRDESVTSLTDDSGCWEWTSDSRQVCLLFLNRIS